MREIAYRNEEGEIIRVPLHDCVIAEGDVYVASFRQDGMFATAEFVEGYTRYVSGEVSDLGRVENISRVGPIEVPS